MRRFLVWSTDIDIMIALGPLAVDTRETGLQPAVQNTYSYA
jgi:hypothetical protein